MRYNNKIYLFLLSASLLLTSCQYLNKNTQDNKIPITEPVESTINGAAALEGKVNIKNSPYYKNIDFYNESPTSTLIKLDKFKTYQQTSEWSCGAACTLMALNYLGISNVTERSLVTEMDVRSHDNPRPDGSIGATTESIVNAFKTRGFKVTSSLDNENVDNNFIKSENDFYKFIINNLKNNNVILIENVEFGGHWRVIIGYDDMGKPDKIDTHIIVFADPYDSTDHNQNGYTIQSTTRLFGSWFDHNVMPPNQRNQQYVCVFAK